MSPRPVHDSGRGMSPIMKLDETMTPTHAFVAMTTGSLRSKRTTSLLLQQKAWRGKFQLEV
jgi:hypothetical protein